MILKTYNPLIPLNRQLNRIAQFSKNPYENFSQHPQYPLKINPNSPKKPPVNIKFSVATPAMPAADEGSRDPGGIVDRAPSPPRDPRPCVRAESERGGARRPWLPCISSRARADLNIYT